MTDARQSRILEQAKKLLERSQHQATTMSGSNTQEHEIAAKLLHKLLEKHQLSMFDVENCRINEAVIEGDVKVDYRNTPSWLIALAGCVADGFDCRHLYGYWISEKPKADVRSRVRRKFTFIGLKSDVEVATYFFNYLFETLWPMSESHGREKGFQRGDLYNYRNSFVIGACRAIRRRLMEERSAAEAAQNNVRALVRVKSKAVNEYMDREYINLRNADVSQHDTDWVGRHDGHIAGDNISLNKSISKETVAGRIS